MFDCVPFGRWLGLAVVLVVPGRLLPPFFRMAALLYWQVLSALASGGGSRRTWLLDAGILPLLHRLTMERARDVAGGRSTNWLYSKGCKILTARDGRWWLSDPSAEKRAHR